MVDTCSNSFPDDGQFAHSGHAQIARRVNLSHALGIAEDPKSASRSQHPVPHRGAFRDRHGRWARDAVDAKAALTNVAEADGGVVWF